MRNRAPLLRRRLLLWSLPLPLKTKWRRGRLETRTWQSLCGCPDTLLLVWYSTDPTGSSFTPSHLSLRLRYLLCPIAKASHFQIIIPSAIHPTLSRQSNLPLLCITRSIKSMPRPNLQHPGPGTSIAAEAKCCPAFIPLVRPLETALKDAQTRFMSLRRVSGVVRKRWPLLRCWSSVRHQ